MSEPIFPTLPPLPVLPHPSTFSTPDAPSQLLIEESRRHLEQLDAFREQLLGGSIGQFSFSLLPLSLIYNIIYSVEYPLSPPGEDALPPLPPIPLPPLHQTYRASPSVSSSKRPKPNPKPPIPSSSYLSQVRTVQACVEAFNKAHTELSATLHFRQSAVLVNLGSSAVVWILLRSVRLDGRTEDGSDARVVRVESVRVHAPPPLGKSIPIHAIPAGPQSTLSAHLTQLDLSLAELLYRLPEIPSLLQQSCFYCQQHLRMPDGLPLYHTGLIGATKSKLLNGGDDATSDVKVKDKVNAGDLEGKWVCWHASCDPPY
ncbi:hypothetical protein BCR39DRAFT_597645 [Naematelia encephala]|uniref:Uncharacterized protein n=1 Tax=Naematelia encephala TaxID=71784 RepID=A0A1Y2BBL7_9TREE|nr:hypothetical protein BCR39DRAFT_597645 [Naematelia encephala]